jgi:hypothetical protein
MPMLPVASESVELEFIMLLEPLLGCACSLVPVPPPGPPAKPAEVTPNVASATRCRLHSVIDFPIKLFPVKKKI